MKTIEKKLNIHDALKISITYPRTRSTFDGINLPFSFFEKDYSGKPELIFKIGPFNRKIRDCDIVFRNTEISKRYIYYKKKNGGSLYEVEIAIDPYENMTINFNWIKKGILDAMFPYYRPQLLILEPIIEFKLLFKKCILLHCAGITITNGALIFAGRSGACKSPIINICLKNISAKYLGDDKVLINDNYAYAFPKNISLFEYELSRKNAMVELNKTIEKAKSVVYISKKRSIDANSIIGDKRKISSIYLLIKSNSADIDLQLEPVNLKSMIEFLIYNNFSEFWNYYDIWDHFMAYSYIYTDFPFRGYMHMLNELLVLNLKDINYIYKLIIPKNCTESSIKYFIENQINSISYK